MSDLKQRVEGEISKSFSDFCNEYHSLKSSIDIWLRESDFILTLLDRCAAFEGSNKQAIQREVKLIAAIKKTINDNLHLADGDNCTLIDLKLVLKELGITPEGERG